MKYNPFSKYLGNEDKLHISICNYISSQYPEYRIHHSPNEGKRSKFERYKISEMGVSTGFPDLEIHTGKEVIYFEIKFGDNIPTDNQSNWLRYLKNSYVVYSLDSAMKILLNYEKGYDIYPYDSHCGINFLKSDNIPKRFFKIK